MSTENEKNPQEMTPEIENAQQVPVDFDDMPMTPVVVQRFVNVKLNDGYVLRKVGQAYMVMPTGARMKDYQGMITLNETGAFLYKEVEKEGSSKEKLIEACMAEYNVPEEEATQAVDSFIEQCSDCGLMPYEEVFVNMFTKEAISKEEAMEMARKTAEARAVWAAEKQAQMEKEKEANESEQ